MNHQLGLAIKLNDEATLQDFCWGNNTLLRHQLTETLYGHGDRLLYLWGSSGCGKSHLLQACCHALNEGHRAIYLPLKVLHEWGPDAIEGIDDYHFIGLDDLDVIAGNRLWEEALFHLYNRIRDNGKTIMMMSGQTAATHLSMALPDLKSRLTWCLSLFMQELSDLDKIQSLQTQAHKRGFEFSESVGQFLLSRCSRNMHELHTILNRLDDASLVAQRRITIPFVKMILQI